MMEPAGIAPNAVDTAITSRRSVRAFRPDPVPRALVEHLLDVAARAPSGTNMQPWRVHVLTGAARDRLAASVLSAFESDAPQPPHEYRYYPEKFFEPFQSRRRKVGFDMYGLLGIARGDVAAMKRQHGRNFVFFDAPVALIFTIDRRLEIGSWLDYGMFLQNIMVAARGHGLDTCPQAAFQSFHAVIRAQLDLAPEELVICGMALGVAEPDAVVNRLTTERVPVREFATFHEDT
jgi:nitroreductase